MQKYLFILLLLVLSCEETTPVESDRDTKSPVIQITAPTDSTIVYETVQYINAIAIDDYKLDTLFLFLNDSSVDSIIIGETQKRDELRRVTYQNDDTYFLLYWDTAGYIDSTWYDVFIQAKDASNNIGYSDTISLYLDTIDNPLSNHRLVYTTEDGMHVVNADGENYIKISDDLAIELLSTDDKIIYTSSSEFGQAEIYSINFDGTDRTRLTYTTESEESIELTANGQKIFYNLSNKYYTIDIDGSNNELLNDFSSSFQSETYFDFAIQSSNIFVSELCNHHDFNAETCTCDKDFIFDLSHDVPLVNISKDGSNLTYIERIMGWPYGNSNYSVVADCNDVWEPLGCSSETNEGCNWIQIWGVDEFPVVDSDVNDNNYLYFVSSVNMMNIDSTNISSVTEAQFGDIYEITFSATGEQLFLIGKTRENHEIGLYSINTDGSNQNLLTHNVTSSTSLLIQSSDSEQLLYIYNNDIYLINSDGSNEANITLSSFTESSPRFSYDRQLIGFISDRDDSNDIFFIKSGDDIDISSWYKLVADMPIINFIFLPNP